MLREVRGRLGHLADHYLGQHGEGAERDLGEVTAPKLLLLISSAQERLAVLGTSTF